MTRSLLKIDSLRTSVADEQADKASFSSVDQALQDDGSDLVVISVPGEYAADEAKKALASNKSVMIFSDNVSIEDEISLKKLAHEKGLLVMGPDCGTAIINGVGLCFANKVKDGPVGVVAASGTGSQEVSVQVDRLGSGISQLVGVGGRDLSEQVGGIMMIDAMNMLNEDDETKVIILLSKPPAESVAQKVLDVARGLSKPVVVCFIGDKSRQDEANIKFVHSTIEAAKAAVSVVGSDISAVDVPVLVPEVHFSDEQKNIRGVFCGGTICDEVFYVLRDGLGKVWSNVAKSPEDILPVGEASHDTTVLDLGSDEFTRGRAHPMIDPTLRNQHIIKEASDPSVAVILLDFVIGFGSHQDPVGAATESIIEAKRIADEAGRRLVIVAYVLGTDQDPQNKSEQIQKLRSLGVVVVNNVIELSEIALKIIKQ